MIYMLMMWCTWNSNSPFLAFQGDTRCGSFTNTTLVECTHLELIESVFFQVRHLSQEERRIKSNLLFQSFAYYNCSFRSNVLELINENFINLPQIQHLDAKTCLIRCVSDCLVVELIPLACDSIFNCPVVQIVPSDICSSVVSRSGPAQHHVVTNTLQQGDTGGSARGGCSRNKFTLALDHIIDAFCLLDMGCLCVFIECHQHMNIKCDKYLSVFL